MRCYGPEYFRRTNVMRFGPGLDYRNYRSDIEACKVKGYSQIVGNFDLRGKVILDVGCATGALLHSLKKHSPAQLIGIDIAEHQIAYGRDHYGIDLRCLKLEEANFAASEFDLIIMLDIIEHVWEIRTFFASAVRCLKPGGAMFIRTPNADSYWIAQRRWNYLYCGFEHIAYLSTESLAFLANDHGMVVERIYSEGCPSILPYTRRHKLAKLFFEPAKVLTNRWQGWRLASAPQSGLGLDMCAIVKKTSESVPL